MADSCCGSSPTIVPTIGGCLAKFAAPSAPLRRPRSMYPAHPFGHRARLSRYRHLRGAGLSATQGRRGLRRNADGPRAAACRGDAQRRHCRSRGPACGARSAGTAADDAGGALSGRYGGVSRPRIRTWGPVVSVPGFTLRDSAAKSDETTTPAAGVVAARLSHIGLQVPDLSRMQAFYTNVLGLSASDRGLQRAPRAGDGLHDRRSDGPSRDRPGRRRRGRCGMPPA